MKKLIQILAIIALIFFIFLSVPIFIKTIKEIKLLKKENELNEKVDEKNQSMGRISNDDEITFDDLLNDFNSELDEQFEIEKSNRYTKVKENLIDIRTIMNEFKNTYAYYSSNWDSIISFVQSQKFNKNINTHFQDINNIRFVPFSDKQEFYIKVGQLETKNGKNKPVFQVKAHHNYFLIGLDRMAVVKLNESLRMNGKYPGLFIGSLDEDNGGKGNWE